MDITTILNRKQSAALVAAEGPFQQQFVPSPFGSPSSPRMKPEPGVSDPGDHQVLAYPTHAPLGQMNLHQGLQYAPRTQPSTSMPLMQNAYYPGGYASTSPMPNGIAAAPTGRADPPPKTFYCSTCNKGFARRSDLARHGTSLFWVVLFLASTANLSSERIHTGIRPHACDWPGCGKQFIQRSALTVHSRVHTGEKPHMCERCGKVCLVPRLHRLEYSNKLFSYSLLAIRRRSQDIAESTPESAPTSVRTRTAKRPSPAVPP